MLGSLLSPRLREHERRPAWLAFAFLSCLMASHAVLETARDALFLALLPASRLPAGYLAIAALSLVVARAEQRLAVKLPRWAVLPSWGGLAAVGTAVFWLGVGSREGAWFVYGLYVWTGIVTSLVLVHFWSLLAEASSVTQAKRLYPLIGSGSVCGALLGSALASLLSRSFGAPPLLLVAAGGFAASALLAGVLVRAGFAGSGAGPFAGPAPAADPVLDMHPIAAAETAPARDARLTARDPYLRRVAGLMLVSAACLTLLDYAWKSQVAASVPAAQLGTFFGSVALGLNALSLLCQLLLAPYVLKRFDLTVALAALPLCLVLAGAGLAAGLGLAAALLGKAADGSLRYSLHRTASELLYVPVPDTARTRAKALIDTLVQRAGQALASLLILLLAALSAPPLVAAGALVLLAVAWAASAYELRRDYLDLLRRQVRDVTPPDLPAFPDLDVASLETVLTALDSPDDNEVLAALDVLERERKARLVPALILHHPSEAVVLRALGLFARVRRKDAVYAIDRLFEHASLRVRCDAIAARSSIQPDARLLFARLSLEESPEVRATIAVHLIASGDISGAEARERLEEIQQRGLASTRAALATAVAFCEDHRFDGLLVALSSAPELEVRSAALAAMAKKPCAAFLPALIAALGDERVRHAARRALLAHGKPGFEAVQAALSDRSLGVALRWELPRALASFAAQDAASVLLAHWGQEPDGMLRYRIIRTLEALAAREPRLALDPQLLSRAIRETLSRAYRYLDARSSLQRGAEAEPARHTPGHALLVHVLTDKEKNACGRLLRLLGLANPTADFARIRRGLRSGSEKTRAKCVELLGSSLQQPLRSAVLGLFDELPDDERLASAGEYYRARRLDYEALLEQLLAHESASLQDFTAYHIAELELTRLAPLLAALAQRQPGRADLVRALGKLGQPLPPIREEELAPC
ncbi:MAG TPA: Npt1/Npt2 family nucleotide transporter [Polyangiales bacterium]|nr:Npt1/Npt2 family nucleotide transporter [Polyangiales bacterium]